MTIPIADPAAPRGRDPIRRLIAATNPILRPLAGTRWFRLWGVIQHTGRKSGKAYATPIVARRYGDGFVIPMPFGERTNWANNVDRGRWRVAPLGGSGVPRHQPTRRRRRRGDGGLQPHPASPPAPLRHQPGPPADRGARDLTGSHLQPARTLATGSLSSER